MSKHVLWFLGFAAILAVAAAALPGCGDDDDDDDVATGTLEFYANGEEFIRDGFVAMDGWSMSFEHFYVNYYGPTGIQVAVDESDETTVKHAGHPHNDIPEGSAHEAAIGTFWTDLAEGDDRQLITSIEAPVGNYNYADFAVVKTDVEEWAGYSIVMIGQAQKDAETVAFTIKIEEEMTFSNCRQTVDDEFAGVVEEGGVGSVEITFHSDHIFGDESTLGEPDSVNVDSEGFDSLATLAEGGVLDITQSEMAARMASGDYDTFIAALRTTGHSGEGHCNYEPFEEEEDTD